MCFSGIMASYLNKSCKTAFMLSVSHCTFHHYTTNFFFSFVGNACWLALVSMLSAISSKRISYAGLSHAE